MARITPPLNHRRLSSLVDYAVWTDPQVLVVGGIDRSYPLRGVGGVVTKSAANLQGELGADFVNDAGDFVVPEIRAGASTNIGGTLDGQFLPSKDRRRGQSDQ